LLVHETVKQRVIIEKSAIREVMVAWLLTGRSLCRCSISISSAQPSRCWF